MKNFNNPNKKHDFVMLLEVKDGNPNGDPDSGNLPRIDFETMEGLMTDVSIKRKIRDWISMATENNIYVKHKGILYNEQEKAFKSLNLDKNNKDRATINKAKDWMCKNFYDIRMFGAVMNTKKFNAGQVTGPMQISFARSVDPIVPADISITRVAVTKPEDARSKTENDTEGKNKDNEMGRKQFIPYGLYVAYGFYNPIYAENTGVKKEDLELFWEAIKNMFDLTRSASKGLMSCRGLHIFTHERKFGNAPAHKLFDLINISKRDNVKVARNFKDYKVEINEEEMPEGIELNNLA